MDSSRRRTVLSLAGLGAAAALSRPGFAATTAGTRRVVVVGGGWGGLAAARSLRELAPELEVVLVERSATFFSCPLSNRWLAERLDERLLHHDYRLAAQRFGYRFLQAEVTAIDRERRRVLTAGEQIDYDWLVLATGIRDDYRPWFGDDARAAGEARQRFGSAFQAADIPALKARLASFSGGTLLMTVPPLPYRCPPAPYERACMIASLFRQRRLKARILLLDPNPMMQVFARVFGGQHRDYITYVPQAQLRAVDPFARTAKTEVEDFRFDEAILMPPQQAGALAAQAGLIGQDAGGKASGWAAFDPDSQRSLADPRIYVVGDMVDRASTLFGHYPKTGEMAMRQGQIAAAQIAAAAQGREAVRQLPASTCFVLTGTDPMEMARIETTYRHRGDGLIMQNVRQHYDAQPRDEDVDWARTKFAALFG